MVFDCIAPSVESFEEVHIHSSFNKVGHDFVDQALHLIFEMLF